MEGVVRFHADFFSEDISKLISDCFSEINAWRTLMYLTGMIGQNPNRYGGFGYGNISRRYILADLPHAFVISGSQTGHISGLEIKHYALITECYPEKNRVAARGLTRPSSESMTHGTIYALDNSVNGVIHAHCSEIWRYAENFRIPITSEHAGYGTPEMASEIGRLFVETSVRQQGIFAMGGHEDGIVAFGKNLETAGVLLIRYLALALQIS